MKSTKSVVYLSIVITIVCCLVITGCSKKSDNKDSVYKTNIDLNNDGICDLNCINSEENICDRNCDTNGDGNPDVNIDLNSDGICDVNCDLDYDLVADAYIDMNDDLLYDYDDIKFIIKQEVSNFEREITFSFYCPIGESATECESGVGKSINTVLNEVDNNPYATVYKSIESIHQEIDYENITAQSHRIEVSIKPMYSPSEQKEINGTINTIIKDSITPDLQNDKDKIKAIHDYIITHTNQCQDENGIPLSLIETSNRKKYEELRKTCSNVGKIFQTHMANDTGYANLMSLFLTKMGYENIRIRGDYHSWNAVKLNNIWYHIDIFWDKPFIAGTNYETGFIHQYFMLTTEELNVKNDNEHTYDKNKYYMIK